MMRIESTNHSSCTCLLEENKLVIVNYFDLSIDDFHQTQQEILFESFLSSTNGGWMWWFFFLSREEREKFCHQSRMSLILVASWSNGNKRLTTTSISNFTICPTAVAKRRKKRRQICFSEIWAESCLCWKDIHVCFYEDEECRIYTFSQ